VDYASTLLQLLPSARRLPGLRELLNSIETYLPPEQVERVRGHLESLDTQVRRVVQERPLVAVGAALTLGYALGRLLARR